GDRHVPRRATSLLPRRGGSAKRECGSRTPDPAPRIPDPDAPVDIELISLVDAIAQESPPRKRTRQAGQHRRKRPVYDDAAYFDPAQSEFSAVVDRFDEFAREHSRR